MKITINRLSLPASFKRITITSLLLWVVIAPNAHSAIIGLEATSVTQDFASIDLVISDLGDFAPDSLGAFDISIGFDTSVLKYSNYVLGDFLGNLNLGDAVDISGGDMGDSINLGEVSLLSSSLLNSIQPASFVLATVNFEAQNLLIGETTQVSILSGFGLTDAEGMILPTSATGPLVLQGAGVPLPGTPLLFLSALVAGLVARSLSGYGKKNKLS